MSERLDYDRERTDYQESQPKYRGDFFSDYWSVIEEDIEERAREREREKEREAEYAADTVEEDADAEYSDSRPEKEAVETGNDRDGVEHDTERAAEHVTEHVTDHATEHITEHVTEHATQHGVDDGGVSDYAVARYRWRSRASRHQPGEVRIPPDTREFHAPVFVPLADLTSPPSSDGPDGTAPRPDEENRPPARQEEPFGGAPAIGTSSGRADDQG